MPQGAVPKSGFLSRAVKPKVKSFPRGEPGKEQILHFDLSQKAKRAEEERKGSGGTESGGGIL